MGKKLLVFALLLGCLWISTGEVFGQAPAGEPEAGTPSQHGMSWFDLFKTTGPVGVLLLITSIIGTGLLIQYMRTITETNLSNPEMLAEIEGMLTEGNYEDAMARLETDQTYAGKVLFAALNRSSAGYEEATKAMEETSTVEAFRLNASISYLSLVGNIGPLLGLLGTVTGMISSFQQIEKLKSPTPGDLAKGVYESLVNTTIGLFIAIVFLTAYFFMKNKLTDITLRVNNQITDVLSRTVGQTADQ
ncbi:MAG: MotA/TolQ/ExbB proton channel family protein [Planctomycetota bacterium]